MGNGRLRCGGSKSSVAEEVGFAEEVDADRGDGPAAGAAEDEQAESEVDGRQRGRHALRCLFAPFAEEGAKPSADDSEHRCNDETHDQKDGDATCVTDLACPIAWRRLRI